jgi:hypothetical protein
VRVVELAAEVKRVTDCEWCHRETPTSPCDECREAEVHWSALSPEDRRREDLAIAEYVSGD